MRLMAGSGRPGLDVVHFLIEQVAENNKTDNFWLRPCQGSQRHVQLGAVQYVRAVSITVVYCLAMCPVRSSTVLDT